MEQIFGAALGIKEPIYLEKVEFENELHINLNFYKGAKIACPNCGGANCGIHDTIDKTWRHLNFFQYQCYLHFPLPRIKCDKCGVLIGVNCTRTDVHVRYTYQIKPEWTRAESGFTALFEAFVIMLAKGGMPYSEIWRIVGENDKKLRRIVDHTLQKPTKIRI